MAKVLKVGSFQFAVEAGHALPVEQVGHQIGQHPQAVDSGQQRQSQKPGTALQGEDALQLFAHPERVGRHHPRHRCAKEESLHLLFQKAPAPDVQESPEETR